MTEKIACEKHGEQNEAFICSHLVETLKDRKPRGVIWSRDEEGAINAYCEACDAGLKAAGGAWTEELEEQAGIVAVCEACMMPVFKLNGAEQPG